MVLPPADFESAASTSSAIPAGTAARPWTAPHIAHYRGIAAGVARDVPATAAASSYRGVALRRRG